MLWLIQVKRYKHNHTHLFQYSVLPFFQIDIMVICQPDKLPFLVLQAHTHTFDNGFIRSSYRTARMDTFQDRQ